MLLSGLLGIVLAAGTVLVGASHPRRAGRGHLSAKELTSLELLHNTMVKNIDLTLEVKRNSFLINGRDAQNADDYDQAVEEHLKVCKKAVQRRFDAFEKLAKKVYSDPNPLLAATDQEAEELFGTALKKIQKQQMGKREEREAVVIRRRRSPSPPARNTFQGDFLGIAPKPKKRQDPYKVVITRKS